MNSIFFHDAFFDSDRALSKGVSHLVRLLVGVLKNGTRRGGTIVTFHSAIHTSFSLLFFIINIT